MYAAVSSKQVVMVLTQHSSTPSSTRHHPCGRRFGTAASFSASLRHTLYCSPYMGYPAPAPSGSSKCRSVGLGAELELSTAAHRREDASVPFLNSQIVLGTVKTRCHRGERVRDEVCTWEQVWEGETSQFWTKLESVRVLESETRLCLRSWRWGREFPSLCELGSV